MRLARGLHQAFLRSVDLPRRVRPGHRYRARFHLQVVRGPRITRTFHLRIPGGLRQGRHRLAFVGRDVDDPDADLFGALIDTFTIEGGNETESPGHFGPRSLAELARRIKSIEHYDGVRLRVGGARRRAYRDPQLRISGRTSTPVRVVRRRRR